MSKRNEPGCLRGTGPGRGLLHALPLAVALLALGGAASAELKVDKGASGEPRSEPTYQIRCWQEGKLLFEENGVQLPEELAASGLKLRATDRKNAPIYITETRNATCLVRRTPAGRQPSPER